MGKLEKEIEGPSIRYARKTGWMVLKLNVMGVRGWPDVLFIGGPPLTVMMIEFKRPGENPRRLQTWTINQLRKRGLMVHVVDSYDGACAILDAAWIPRKGNTTGGKSSQSSVIAGPWIGED